MVDAGNRMRSWMSLVLVWRELEVLALPYMKNSLHRLGYCRLMFLVFIIPPTPLPEACIDVVALELTLKLTNLVEFDIA